VESGFSSTFENSQKTHLTSKKKVPFSSSELNVTANPSGLVLQCILKTCDISGLMRETTFPKKIPYNISAEMLNTLTLQESIF